MALTTAIINLIRDEIGRDIDFTDNIVDATGNELDILEEIYIDPARGNSDVLRTAYICWRARMNDYVKRGFDITQGGSLLARRQRMKELRQIVKEYEILVDTTHRGRNSTMLSADAARNPAGAEF